MYISFKLLSITHASYVSKENAPTKHVIRARVLKTQLSRSVMAIFLRLNLHVITLKSITFNFLNNKNNFIAHQKI